MSKKQQNSRGKAWRRHKDYSKAKRKKKISDEVYHWTIPGSAFYDNLHQYSKNKIHCSCPICRNKSRNSGAAALYSGVYNPTIMDARRQLDMDQDYLEYFDDID